MLDIGIPIHSQDTIQYLTSIICVFPSPTIKIHDIEFIFHISPTLMLGLSHSQKAADVTSDIDRTAEPY